MALQLVVVDTNIFLSHFRSRERNATRWTALLRSDYALAASVLTKWEVMRGVNDLSAYFFEQMFHSMPLLPVTESVAEEAVRRSQELKKINKQLAVADLMIGCTAISNNAWMATENKEHFNRLYGLKVI